MSGRREYGLALVVLVIAAIGVVVAYGATWVTATVPVFRGEPTPTRVVDLTGSMFIGFGSAAGWVALASAAGIIATRTWGRVVIGLVAAGAGAAAGIPAVAFILSRGPLVAEALDGDEAVSVDGNAWWLVAILAGLMVMVAGLLTAVRGRNWPSLSARYERSRTTQEVSTVDEPQGDPARGARESLRMWDALDRGEDPTSDPRS